MSPLFCAATKYDFYHVHVVLQLCHCSLRYNQILISIASMLCCSYVTALLRYNMLSKDDLWIMQAGDTYDQVTVSIRACTVCKLGTFPF
jgi:hypothetical protein